MRKMNRLLSSLLVASLLLSSASQIVFGQDEANTGNTVYLPLVSSTTQSEQTDQATETDPDLLQTVDGSISPLSSESTDKAAIQAAAVNAAGTLRPVSLIVTFDSNFDVNSLQAAGQVIHRYQKVFNGASLVTMSNQVEAISTMAGVTGVYLDEMQIGRAHV